MTVNSKQDRVKNVKFLFFIFSLSFVYLKPDDKIKL